MVLSRHGGIAGVRDSGLLLSALAKPKHRFAYGESCDMASMAAAYTAGIARNHPFLDGNKRTAFVVGVLSLERNGHRFKATQDEATEAVLSLVEGRMDEIAYAGFLRTVTCPAEA